MRGQIEIHTVCANINIKTGGHRTERTVSCSDLGGDDCRLIRNHLRE